MPPRSTLAVVLAVGLLLLAGCAGSVAGPGGTSVGGSPTSPTATLGAAPGPSGANGTLEVHFIDVGQGSSTLLVGPTNETMLIDSGGWQDDGEAVIAYLERAGIDRVDYLVTSHADADHIGGHAAVIEHLATAGDGVGAVYDPGIAASTETYEAYLDAVEAHDVPLYRTQAGDAIPFEGVEVNVLAPPETTLADGERNENSIVLRVRYGATSFLLPGDAGEEAEQYLLADHASTLDSTVLLAGHHGSRSSSSGEFLDAVSPAVAVISSDYDSQYGHPHTETLERLAARDIRALWTGVHGSSTLVSDGSQVALFARADATTDPLALRSEPAFSGDGSGDLIRIGIVAASGSTPPEPTPPSTEPGGDGTEAGTITLADVHADASGNDNENRNDEYVVFANAGDARLDLSGWTVTDEAGHTYSFPAGFMLDPGARVTLHTGSGTDADSDLYWGSSQAIWNNGGDTVIVRNAEGQRVLEEPY